MGSLVFPDDLIMAILYFMPQQFSADAELRHRVIKNACNNQETKELFGCFSFSPGPIFPYSEELEQAICNLMHCGILQILAPYYKKFFISTETMGVLEKHAKKHFSTEELDAIAEIAKQWTIKSDDIIY